MNEMELQVSASHALKSIARNEAIKSFFKSSKELYPLVLQAAKRYVAGETSEEAVSEALVLRSKGYEVSLEYIGENIRDEKECEAAKNEFLQLARKVGRAGSGAAISVDLSHIGLTIDRELAFDHLVELANEAALYGSSVMIGAEESTKTEQILDLYMRASERYPNVGITLQAQLNRTENDWHDIKRYPGRIRLVKGAYQEPKEIAIPRSDELNERYLHLAEMMLSSGRQLTIASHDEVIIESARQRGFLKSPNVEVEMLYGIRGDLLKSLKNEGYRTKVYVPYGTEWYLYFCHRLAEFPPHIYRALADMTTPDSARESVY